MSDGFTYYIAKDKSLDTEVNNWLYEKLNSELGVTWGDPTELSIRSIPKLKKIQQEMSNRTTLQVLIDEIEKAHDSGHKIFLQRGYGIDF